MSSKRRRLLVACIALIAVAGGLATTSGNFTAQTRNPTNVFASGTLVLANTKSGGSLGTCLSTAGGSTNTNINNSCETVISSTVAKPGDTTTGRLTLTNNGSINATSLSLFGSACATADAAAEAYHGTGNMCTNLTVYVQQFSNSSFTTPSTCLYGGGSASTCAHTAAKTLSAFQSAYTSGTPLNIGSLAPGASVYIEVGVGFPAASDNSFQGRQATFDLTWTLTQ